MPSSAGRDDHGCVLACRSGDKGFLPVPVEVLGGGRLDSFRQQQHLAQRWLSAVHTGRYGNLHGVTDPYTYTYAEGSTASLRGRAELARHRSSKVLHPGRPRRRSAPYRAGERGCRLLASETKVENGLRHGDDPWRDFRAWDEPERDAPGGGHQATQQAKRARNAPSRRSAVPVLTPGRCAAEAISGLDQQCR